MNKLAANSRRENKAAGAYITVSTAGAERVRAFIPAPLPPRLELAGLQRAFDSALLAGGRAKAMMEATPDGDFFVRSGPGR